MSWARDVIAKEIERVGQYRSTAEEDVERTTKELKNRQQDVADYDQRLAQLKAALERLD